MFQSNWVLLMPPKIFSTTFFSVFFFNKFLAPMLYFFLIGFRIREDGTIRLILQHLYNFSNLFFFSQMLLLKLFLHHAEKKWVNEISPFNFKNPLKSNEKKSIELHFKWMINNLKFDKTMAYNQFIMHSIFREGESVFMGSRWKRFDKHYFSLRKLSIPVFFVYDVFVLLLYSTRLHISAWSQSWWVIRFYYCNACPSAIDLD